MLFTGSSGAPIGCIGCDGQSRFLALEREGVGGGNASAVQFERPWDLDGKVLRFGARITAPNKGRYGVNLWIDGATYGPGVALEIGERSAQYQWSPNATERCAPGRAWRSSRALRPPDHALLAHVRHRHDERRCESGNAERVRRADVSVTDDAVGRIIAAPETRGMLNDTIVRVALGMLVSTQSSDGDLVFACGQGGDDAE